MSNIANYYSISSSTRGKWMKGGEFAYLSTESGVSQIWKSAVCGGKPQQLTFLKERIWSLHIAPNREDLYFTMDLGGNEQEQIFVLRKGEQEPVNLTDNGKARHQFGGVLPDNRTVVYACNARNPVNFDICTLDTVTGESKIVLENTDSYNWPAALSPNGRYFLYNKLKGQSDNHLWMLDLETGKAVDTDPKGEYAQYTSPAWNADSTGFYLATDAGSEYKYLAYYDVASAQISKIYEESWDLEDLEMSPDGRYLAIFINHDGYTELKIMDTKLKNFVNIPSPPKGVMGYFGMDWSEEGHRLLFSLTSGRRPTSVWMLDLEADTVSSLTKASTEGIDSDDLVEPELHHYTSYDGLTVPYWFFKAPHAPEGPAPVVIEIHGGPEGQERPMFDALKEYLVSQGLSIVAPNVRGSVGYGKKYHHLDDVEKRMDSVKDIESLVKHLIEEKIAVPGKIAVMGGSYGGFMTLASVTEYPDLWAAGIDIVGISNFETFLENTAEYRRAHRESEYGSLAHHREILRKVSPIHKVDRIIAPLMVIHGANDPRVPVGEAEQIVNSLKSRNVPVEYLCYADEGHGLAKRKNQLDCYPQVAAFLKKHLGLEHV